MHPKITHAVDLIYIEGSGDIARALSRWHNKEDLVSETSKTFSGQVFDFCKKNKLGTLAISYNDKRSAQFDHFTAVSFPRWQTQNAVGFHISQLLNGIRIVWYCLKYKPKYLHIVNGATHWIALAPLKLTSTKIIPHFHNSLWANGFGVRGLSSKLQIKSELWFLKYIVDSVLCCSPVIKHQIVQGTNKHELPCHVFKAQFYKKDFEQPYPIVPHQKKPFIITFAGRTDSNKGVFDIIEMAKKLKHANVEFHICGDQGHFELMQHTLKKNDDLKSIVYIHGKLNRPQLLEIYKKSHTIIVPTRSEFREGLPMVAIEAILLNKPVITSCLSNALDVLGDAIMEAEPENIDSYVEAITTLANDEELYLSKQSACQSLRDQFLDGKQGLTSVMQKTIQN